MDTMDAPRPERKTMLVFMAMTTIHPPHDRLAVAGRGCRLGWEPGSLDPGYDWLSVLTELCNMERGKSGEG